MAFLALLESEMLYVNQIYRFLKIILITITILDITYLLFKTKLNSIGLSVRHRKYTIMIPLRPQYFNVIYRFVAIAYITITVLDTIHRQRLDSVYVFR
jgi:hypothetical protein